MVCRNLKKLIINILVLLFACKINKHVVFSHPTNINNMYNRTQQTEEPIVLDLNKFQTEKVICEGINHIINILSNTSIEIYLCSNELEDKKSKSDADASSKVSPPISQDTTPSIQVTNTQFVDEKENVIVSTKQTGEQLELSSEIVTESYPKLTTKSSKMSGSSLETTAIMKTTNNGEATTEKLGYPNSKLESTTKSMLSKNADLGCIIFKFGMICSNTVDYTTEMYA